VRKLRAKRLLTSTWMVERRNRYLGTIPGTATGKQVSVPELG